jgi:hypothetical protein
MPPRPRCPLCAHRDVRLLAAFGARDLCDEHTISLADYLKSCGVLFR